MADEEFQGKEKGRFPLLLGLGVLFAVAVNVAAFIADDEYGIPVLLLTVICVVAAVAFRLIAGGSRSGGGSDSDSESNFPTQEARSERPLGDTPEAHDEISVHDIPIDSPERHRTEDVAKGQEQVTRGPIQ